MTEIPTLQAMMLAIILSDRTGKRLKEAKRTDFTEHIWHVVEALQRKDPQPLRDFLKKNQCEWEAGITTDAIIAASRRQAKDEAVATVRRKSRFLVGNAERVQKSLEKLLKTLQEFESPPDEKPDQKDQK